MYKEHCFLNRFNLRDYTSDNTHGQHTLLELTAPSSVPSSVGIPTTSYDLHVL